MESERNEKEEEEGFLQATRRMLIIISLKPFMKYTILLVAILLDTLDCVTDWLLYDDISKLDRGLVYGPISSTLKASFLAFSIIGTFIFILEIFNAFLESFTQHSQCLPGDWTSILTIWIEDLPQSILNVILSACHEYTVSVIQIFKATILIIGFLIRLIATILRYYAEDKACERQNCKLYKRVKRSRNVARVLLFSGVFLQFICAILIFKFSLLTTHKGYMEFRTVDGFFKSTLNPRRYFNDMYIFLDRKYIQLESNRFVDEYDYKYLKLCSLYDVIYSQKQKAFVNVNLLTYKKDNFFELAIHNVYHNETGSQIITNRCYQENQTTQNGLNFHIVNCLQLKRQSLLNNLSIEFEFSPPSSRLMFGDIYYRIKSTTESNHLQNDNLDMRYFQIENSTSTLLEHVPIENRYRPFNALNMKDIYKVWSTGFLNCNTTGEIGPQLSY